MPYETMNRVAQLVGAPLGGLLIYWLGTQGAIWIDAVSFAACAALVAVFVHPKADQTPPAAADQPAAREPYLVALRTGAHHLAGDRLLFGMIAALFVINVFTHANVAVFIPLWIAEVLRSPAGLGLVIGAYGTGAVLGSLTFTMLATRLPRFRTFAIGVVLAGAPRLFALGLSASLTVVLVVTFLSGVAISSGSPILGALLYERVPPGLQTRVFGLVAGICIAGFPLGGVLAGLTVASLGLRPAILVAGFTCLALTLASLQWYRRGDADRPRTQQRSAHRVE